MTDGGASSPRSYWRCLLLAALLLRISSPAAIAADKTDVVTMNNGDRFVGEIKKVEVGRLEFKASYMATSVDLDWTKVAEVESVRHFRVEFEDGNLYAGVIHKSLTPPGADFTVVSATESITRGALEVVSIQPLEGSFIHRFKGSADVGLTLHPDANQTQWTANLSAQYPAERFRTFVQVSSLFNSQEGAEDIVRDSLSYAHYQFMSKKWFLVGMSQLLRDSELSLNLRATFSGGAGRFFVHTNRTGLALLAGIASTHEDYFQSSSTGNGNTAEVLMGLEFYTVKFARSQVNTRLLVYSGITERGRYRVDWESSVSWKFYKDVYWKLTMLENFDGRPPEGARSNDFSLTTSFGLTF